MLTFLTDLAERFAYCSDFNEICLSFSRFFIEIFENTSLFFGEVD